MAAEQVKQATRETWEDWLPLEAAAVLLGPRADKSLLITRADLLERLGGAVAERELRYWESIGALPRPVRRFHHGAVHALYPNWYVDILANVHLRRAEKLPPDEVRSYVRDLFDNFAARLAGWQPRHGPMGGPLVPHGLIAELERFTCQLAAKHGIRAAAATLELRGEDGRRLSWRFPLFGGGATTLGYSSFDDTAAGEQVVSDPPDADKY